MTSPYLANMDSLHNMVTYQPYQTPNWIYDDVNTVGNRDGFQQYNGINHSHNGTPGHLASPYSNGLTPPNGIASTSGSIPPALIQPSPLPLMTVDPILHGHQGHGIARSEESVSPDLLSNGNGGAGGIVKKINGQNGGGGVGKWKSEKEGPVKNACLTCRGKKAKCDGAQPICGQCERKNFKCEYVKSRRGGARKKRDVAPPSALQEFLKKLDTLMSVMDPSLSPGPDEAGDDTTNVVRTFGSREDILTRYYNEVHPFLPVMPPRKWLSEILPTLAPESPFLLAAQTIMVLVPHPRDPNPKSATSKRLRMTASAKLGQQTMDVVSRLLEDQSTIECVQALCMLSLWEWGNAGNLNKNRARAGQAVQVAMELGMHEMDKDRDRTNSGIAIEGKDWHRDMARRTWWVVYVAQMTAAIISGNAPVVGPDDPRILVDFPVCSLEDRAWPNWVNTNRHCCRVFALVNSIYYGVGESDSSSWGSPPDPTNPPGGEEDISKTKKTMLMIDEQVMEFMKQAEATSIIELVPGGEEEVVRNQQLSARLGLAVTHIHIHRQQAFPEVSLFSKAICGLPQSGATGENSNSSPAPYDNHQDARAIASGNGSSPAEGPSFSRLSISTDSTTTNGNGHSHDNTLADIDMETLTDNLEFTEEMWQPETYPENLPAPWFAHSGGAAALIKPVDASPQHYPALTTGALPSASNSAPTTDGQAGRRESGLSAQSIPRSTAPNGNGTNNGNHKAWGVDANDKIVIKPGPDPGLSQIFPPGISLARCATAAHTIVRLEVLHRSAVIAMWEGPPKWLPFCSCGLVTGAYAFLLLALAVQAENNFGEYDASKTAEVEALLTNVKVILAGLEAYGVMWGGIEVMANEVRAALEAATRLPYEVRAQIESTSGSPPDTASQL